MNPSPKDNLRLRLQIRDDVSAKLESEVESVIDLFLEYNLDYFSVLQILSTHQYLRLCRKALSLPVTKPEHIAFINYSILSLSLETPITCIEYNEAVSALRNLERSRVPPFLHQEIDEFFDLINEENQTLQYSNEVIDDEEIAHIDIQDLYSTVNMSEIFNKEPINHDLSSKAIKLHQCLQNGASTDILISNLSDATNEFTDFSTLLDYFSFQSDIYKRFADLILAIVYVSYSSNNKSTENISMFKKHFAITKASSYFLEICNIVTKDFIGELPPIQSFPSDFNKDLTNILNLCSEFTNDFNYHILAAIQLSMTDINESIAHFALAISYNYSRSKEISDRLAACGIELLIQEYVPKKKGYAAALYQFVCDEDILAIMTNNSMKLTKDELLEAMPYFWNFDILHLIMPEDREQQQFILAYSAKNMEESDTILTFRDLCTLRLLNSLDKDFSISNLHVFNVDKAESNK